MSDAELLELLRELVEIESPTYSPGVRAVAERMGRELERLGADVRLLEGDHLVADLPGRGEPLLVLGHCDTVWPNGTLSELPFRVEDGKAYGPGVYDMKACLVLALAAVEQAGPDRRGVRVFLTADEERGSVTAREAMHEATAGVAAALVVEPTGPRGGLKTARKGVGRFVLSIGGRPAHSGTNPADGISAIEEVAHQVLALHGLTDHERGVTVNVGVVAGGTTENVVAAAAEARFDIRVPSEADRDAVDGALAGLRSHVEGTSLELSGAWTRPPLERSAGSDKLFAKAREYGLGLGLDLVEGSSGGGSDGNLVGALGVPVLDGLGVEGGGAHARHEHVLLASLPVRAQLLARMLQDPGL